MRISPDELVFWRYGFLVLNSTIVKERIQAKPGGRLSKLLNADPPLSNEKIVDELFLATLSRHPSASEQRVAIAQTEKYRNAGAEDVLWGLINKLDFIFNY